MIKQHSDDFKLSAVKLYLKINSIRKVSELFNLIPTHNINIIFKLSLWYTSTKKYPISNKSNYYKNYH